MAEDNKAPESNDLQAQLEQAKTELESLKKKNSELLEEKKQTSEKNKQFSSELDELKNWKISLENEKAELEEKKAKEKGDFEKMLELERVKFDKKYSEIEQKYSSEQAYVNKLLIDNNLKDSLVKNNIKTELLDGAMAMIKPNAKIIMAGDQRKAVVGDVELSDYVAQWAESDAGKAYRSVPVTQGGGAAGSSSNSANSSSWTKGSGRMIDTILSESAQ